MSVVKIGPVLAPLEFRTEDQLDVGFRVLLDYNVGTDMHMARLDLLKSGVQVNTGLCVRRARNEGRVDELVMPKNFEGFSIQANSQDLITSLRGLADRLEQQLFEEAAKK